MVAYCIIKGDNMKITNENISEYKKEDVQDHLSELRSVINKLEWDEKHNQLNPGKKVYLEKIRKEHEELKMLFERIFADK